MLVRSCFLLAVAVGCGQGLFADVLYSVTDLGTLGGTSSSGIAINNAGQVTGASETSTGDSHPFLYSNGQMTDVGTLPGDFASRSVGMNNAGQVTGYSVGSSIGIPTHAFLYTNGLMTDLGSLGGGYSVPATYMGGPGKPINDAGQVTGISTTAGGEVHAFLYSNGQMADLGTLEGGSSSIGRAINNAGQVVGSSTTTATSFNHAFLYSNGQMIDLGTLAGTTNSSATAINDAGQVVGISQLPASYGHTFLYSNGQMTDLGTLEESYGSFSIAINNAGQVIGFADTFTGERHAFLYSNGQMTDLGTLGGDVSEPTAINNAGQVTGVSTVSPTSSLTHAFLYSNGQMADLNDLINPALGITLSSSPGINELGQILANGSGGSGAFLLTPVPEPSTFALFGVAASGLCAWVRHRARASR